MIGSADLVLREGRVYTVDPQFTVASAVAVAGDRIVAVGAEAEELIGPRTHVVDLGGRTVLPGINDAHLHLALFGQSRPPFAVDLTTVDSLAALRRALADAATGLGGGEWLTGQGWRDATITEFATGRAAPHRHHIDAVTGDRPTILQNASAHAVLVNTAALQIAGVTAETPDPVGGHIELDHNGDPTGLLLEAASVLVSRHVPAHTEKQRLDAIESAMRTLNSLGVTSVTDPIVWPELLRDYGRLHREGRMSVRVNTLLHWEWPSPSTSLARLTSALENSGLTAGLGDDWLRIGGCKLFADGVPSHCTAWLHDPYCNGTNGHLVTAGEDDDERSDELSKMIELVHRNRLQVQIHVTGDRAADAAIDGIIAALERDPWPDARHALIHGTLLTEQSLARLAKYDISVVTSSLMRTHSGPSIAPAIGEQRWARAFPAAALRAAGVHVADSSDAPVTYPDWRRGLATFTGCARHALAQVPPDLQLSREQAIRLWTNAGAYLEHAEHKKGSIEAGKLADLVVLKEDPMVVADDELADLTPEMTLVAGQVVFSAGGIN